MYIHEKYLWLCLVFIRSFCCADILISDCSEELKAMVELALRSEIPEMLSDVSVRTADMIEILRTKKLRPSSSSFVPAPWRSFIRTFGTLIAGSVENLESYEQQQESIPILKRFLNTLNALEKNLRDQPAPQSSISRGPHLEVTCSTSWLWNIASWNPEIAQANNLSPHEWFWDMRPSNDMSPPAVAQYLPQGLNSLQTPGGKDLEAFVNASKPFDTVLVLNKHNIAKWQLNSLSADAIQTPYWTWKRRMFIQNSTPQVGSVALTDLTSNHLSAVLIKGLAKTKSMISNKAISNEPLREDHCIPAPGMYHVNEESVWQCMDQLAQNYPDKADKNAASFQHLIVALYLDTWDWSSGVNIPPTSSKDYRKALRYERARQTEWLRKEARLTSLTSDTISKDEQGTAQDLSSSSESVEPEFMGFDADEFPATGYDYEMDWH